MHGFCAHMHSNGTHKWGSPKRWRHCRRKAPTTWSTHFGWSPAAAALPPWWKLEAPSWSTFSVVFSEKSGSLAAECVGVQNRRREWERRAGKTWKGRARFKGGKGARSETSDQRAWADASLKTTQFRLNFVMVDVDGCCPCTWRTNWICPSPMTIMNLPCENCEKEASENDEMTCQGDAQHCSWIKPPVLFVFCCSIVN